MKSQKAILYYWDLDFDEKFESNIWVSYKQSDKDFQSPNFQNIQKTRVGHLEGGVICSEILWSHVLP